VSPTEFIDTYLPLHPWTGRFTVSANILSDLARLIEDVDGRFVSAPVAGFSSYALQRHGSACGRSFLRRPVTPGSHPPARQPH